MDIINNALGKLDPENDNHWTADGLPRVDATVGFAPGCGSLDRKQITDAAPEYNRETARQAAAARAAEDAKGGNDGPTVADCAAKGAPGVKDLDPGYVEPEDDVVAMETKEVYPSLDLVDRAIAEFARQAAVLAARRDIVLDKIKDVGRRSELLENQRNRLTRGKNADRSRDQVQAYLKAQKEARARRAARAQKFIEAGTTAQDVADQLAGPSKIDKAMGARKPARGAARPSYPAAPGQ